MGVSAVDPLSAADRRVLVRLASGTAEIGPSMEAEPVADMFRPLTDPLTGGLGDHPQLTRETMLAEQLPDERKAIGATMQEPLSNRQ